MLQTKQNKKHPDCSNLILYSEINPFCSAPEEEFPGPSFDAPRGQEDAELSDFKATWFNLKSNVSDQKNNYKFSLSVIFGSFCQVASQFETQFLLKLLQIGFKCVSSALLASHKLELILQNSSAVRAG